MKDLEYKIQSYIESPSVYWAGSNIFHKRNINKVVKHRDLLLSRGVSISKYAREMANFLCCHRALKDRTAIYLQSCGGSGCHFVGDLMGSSSNAEMINEVYFPDAFKYSNHLIDFVNIFHSSKKQDFNDKVVLVNTGHLRSDFDPNCTKSTNTKNLVVCLIRNPFNVAVSLALRKQDYRGLTSAGLSDCEYFESRCRHISKFHKEVKKNKFDDIVFYENFLNLPKANLKSFFNRHDIPFSEEDVDRVVSSNDSKKGGAQGAVNFNSAERSPLDENLVGIYMEYLSESDREWGYE